MELTLTTFVSLDGVMQGPGGAEEDPSGGFDLGGWMIPFADEEFGGQMSDWFGRADAFLLGRCTYDTFFGFWPSVTDPDDVVATALNTKPKHVASRSRPTLTWEGAHVLGEDVPAAVRALKEQPGGELQVHGSAGLAQTLIAHDLVDEYRLYVCPVVLGRGKRLFGEGARPATLTRVSSQTTSTGGTLTVLRPAGALRQGGVTIEDGREVIEK